MMRSIMRNWAEGEPRTRHSMHTETARRFDDRFDGQLGHERDYQRRMHPRQRHIIDASNPAEVKFLMGSSLNIERSTIKKIDKIPVRGTFYFRTDTAADLAEEALKKDGHMPNT